MIGHSAGLLLERFWERFWDVHDAPFPKPFRPQHSGVGSGVGSGDVLEAPEVQSLVAKLEKSLTINLFFQVRTAFNHTLVCRF